MEMGEPVTVTIEEAQERFEEFFELAVDGTPVIITCAGKPSVALIRQSDHLAFTRLVEQLKRFGSELLGEELE